MNSSNVKDGLRQAVVEAINKGDCKTVAFWLKSPQYDIHAIDSEGETVLYVAAGAGNAEIVQMLLNAGARNTPDNNGVTPLDLAISYGDRDIVALFPASAYRENTIELEREGLKTSGLDNYSSFLHPNTDKENKGFAELVNLVHKNDYEGMEHILRNNSRDINNIYQIHENKTVLYLAVERGSLDMAKLLLDNGADVNKCDIDGKAPLHVAVESGSLDMVKLLLENDANIEGLCYDFAPCDIAVKQDNEAIVKLLIYAGSEISPNIYNSLGDSEWNIKRYVQKYSGDVEERCVLFYSCVLDNNFEDFFNSEDNDIFLRYMIYRNDCIVRSRKASEPPSVVSMKEFLSFLRADSKQTSEIKLKVLESIKFLPAKVLEEEFKIHNSEESNYKSIIDIFPLLMPEDERFHALEGMKEFINGSANGIISIGHIINLCNGFMDDIADYKSVSQRIFDTLIGYCEGGAEESKEPSFFVAEEKVSDDYQPEILGEDS